MLYKSIQQACWSNIIFQMNKPASLKSLKGQMGFLRATFDKSPKHQHLVGFQHIMVGRIERQIRSVTIYSDTEIQCSLMRKISLHSTNDAKDCWQMISVKQPHAVLSSGKEYETRERHNLIRCFRRQIL